MNNTKTDWDQAGPWTTVIKPQEKFFHLDLGGLLQYKYLIYLFIRRDFVAQFKQTILGPLWFILQPLMTTGIYSIVFGGVANIPTDGIPQPLFYLVGITFWTFFQSVLINNAPVLAANVGLFGKVYFPRLVVPIANAVSQLYKFAIQLALLLVVFFFYLFAGAKISPNILLAAVPLVMLQHGLLALGLGLWASAWTVKYRDLNHLINFGMGLWMWGTPIVYPFSQALDDEFLRTVIWLNPVAPGLELIRFGFTGAGTADLVWWSYSWALSLTIFIIGLALFHRTERTYVDVA